MATVCNVFLVTLELSFLAGQVSYGHKLFNVSLNEGERQGCPNTNCAGKENCKNDADCPGSKCCIDAVTKVACCYQAGDPTHAPAQAAAFPLCKDYYPNTHPSCTLPTDCPCEVEAPHCFENEICCAYTEGDIPSLLCFSTIPPTTTAAPAGERCPAATPALQCAPFQDDKSCIITEATETAPAVTSCRGNEICCKVGRGVPCCVVYP